MDLEPNLLKANPRRAHLAAGGRTRVFQGLGEGGSEGIVVPSCSAHLGGASAPPGHTGGAGGAGCAVGRWGMPSRPHATETLGAHPALPAPAPTVPLLTEQQNHNQPPGPVLGVDGVSFLGIRKSQFW